MSGNGTHAPTVTAGHPECQVCGGECAVVQFALVQVWAVPVHAGELGKAAGVSGERLTPEALLVPPHPEELRRFLLHATAGRGADTDELYVRTVHRARPAAGHAP